MNPQSSQSGYVFFGSAEFSVYVLDEMKKQGFTPAVIVTTPDKQKGRNLILSPNPVKVWGEAQAIPVLDPAKLDQHFIDVLNKTFPGAALFVVAAYGKLIPQTILSLPPRATLNIHPSLLPLYRGAAPLQSAMLDDKKETGVTIMKIDAEMDHGPIVAQKRVDVAEWPTYEVFEEEMARAGAQLLSAVIPDWMFGKIKEREQDHAGATFTRKFTKEDGLVNIATIADKNGDAIGTPAEQYELFRKIQAFHLWPSVYFFADRKNSAQKIRVKITDASWQLDPAGGRLIINNVIPEGKPETDFKSFMRSV